ncbi:MAG: hypothetical protein HOP16_12885 [Acidobacteria bacterium]|nr:hypothetical protein [Acidobacteriota bacterium]
MTNVPCLSRAHLPAVRWFVRLIAVLALGPGSVAAQERPVPGDSSRIIIAGCARDRAFVVGIPEGREVTQSDIQPGRRFRLSGPRQILNDIKRRELSMIEVTGLVRKSDMAGPGGVTFMGGRIRIGGTAPRDAVRDPMYNQVVIDVEGYQLLPDACPSR